MTVYCCPRCKVILTFIPPEHRTPLKSGVYCHDWYGCPGCGSNLCKPCAQAVFNTCQKCGTAMEENQRFIIEREGLDKLPPFLREIDGLEARLKAIEEAYLEMGCMNLRSHWIFDVIEYAYKYENYRGLSFDFNEVAYRREFDVLLQRLQLFLANIDVSEIFTLSVRFNKDLALTTILMERYSQFEQRINNDIARLQKRRQRMLEKKCSVELIDNKLSTIWMSNRAPIFTDCCEQKIEYAHDAYNKYWYSMQSYTDHPDLDKLNLCLADFTKTLIKALESFDFHQDFRVFLGGHTSCGMEEIW